MLCCDLISQDFSGIYCLRDFVENGSECARSRRIFSERFVVILTSADYAECVTESRVLEMESCRPPRET